MNPVARAIDGAISAVFPGWGLKRSWARYRRDVLQRSLGSGPPDRTSAKSRRNKRGPVEEQRKSLVETRYQARELHRTDPYARGAINTLVSQMVGRGAVPVPSVALKAGGDPNEKFNDSAEAAWQAWAEACDVEGRRSFAKIQSLLMREKLVAGEVLVIFSHAQDGRAVPLALEVVPSERLDHTIEKELAGGGRIVQGVEFDAGGKRVAYWIWPEHPTDFSSRKSKPQRIPAERVVHWYDELEAGQVRGFTRFMTIAGVCEGMSQWLDWVMTKERVATAFALMFKEGISSYGAPDSTEQDQAGNMLDQLEGGMIFHGKPGDDIAGVSSGVQSQQVDVLAQLFLRMQARGLDLSYEAISQDYSKVTYLSARQSENQSRRHYEPQQEDFSGILTRIWREWLRNAVAAGVLAIPRGADVLRYQDHTWVFPGWDWVDPKVDISGDLLAVQAGFKSPLEVITRRGGKPWKVLSEIAQFQAWSKEKGLNLAMFAMPSGTVPPPDAGATPDAADSPDSTPADSQDAAATDSAAQDIRGAIDAYGIAVRAGVVTPQREDESHFRGLLSLPEGGAEVDEAWAKDKGTRRPITLVPPDGATQAAPVAPVTGSTDGKTENADAQAA